MIALPKSLEDLRAKRQAKLFERVDIGIAAEKARRDLDLAFDKAEARRAELGQAEVNHERHGGPEPTALRKQVGADQMLLLTLQARAQGYRAEQQKLAAEFIAGMDEYNAAVTDFKNVVRAATNQKCLEILQDCKAKLQRVHAEARGQNNSRVLDSLSTAVLLVNGRNVFYGFRPESWGQVDGSLKAIAKEWNDVFTELVEEVREQ
jgi:hypothetical protein